MFPKAFLFTVVVTITSAGTLQSYIETTFVVILMVYRCAGLVVRLDMLLAHVKNGQTGSRKSKSCLHESVQVIYTKSSLSSDADYVE